MYAKVTPYLIGIVFLVSKIFLMTQELLLFALLSGITIPIGGLLANFFNHHLKESPIKAGMVHFIMSFGAGIMLSAVALVLIPAGLEDLDVAPMGGVFLAGTIIFMWVDRWLAKLGGRLGTLLAMLMDFIPESIAMGAVYLVDPKTACLLAIFIGVQNMPEAFNAFRDLVLGGVSISKALFAFTLMGGLGVVGAFVGHTFLSESPEGTAYLMVFAGGGILYLLVQDIIPESKLDTSYKTSMGASFGFVLGIISEMLVG